MEESTDNTIQFEAEDEIEALKAVSQIRSDEIDVSELARLGFREQLRKMITDDERIEIHQRYMNGELFETVVALLLSDGMEEIRRETESFEVAMDLDSDEVYQ